MSGSKGAKRAANKSPKTPAREAATGTFSAEERAAMKERAKEMKLRTDMENAEATVLAKIEEMSGSDRVLAERLHEIVRENAPELVPRLWYGMPAYTRDGKVVCFFQAALKFKTRYATFAFMHAASLDDGTMWPTSFAVIELTAADVAKIVALVRKAAR